MKFWAGQGVARSGLVTSLWEVKGHLLLTRQGGGILGVLQLPFLQQCGGKEAGAGPRRCLPDAEMDGVGQDPGGSEPRVQPFNAG